MDPLPLLLTISSALLLKQPLHRDSAFSRLRLLIGLRRLLLSQRRQRLRLEVDALRQCERLVVPAVV